jgi:hypothetical protein
MNATVPGKLAQLIATMEGFYVPGSLPQRNQNPGDLRHSPHSEHPGNPDSVGVIDSVADGWADLQRQLELYASRGMTVQQAIYEFAPPTENDTENYLAFVCKGLGCTPGTLMSDVLAIPAT